MRFLLGISIFAIAACSSASSSDLFGGAPVVTEEDASATEPSDPGEPPAAPPSEQEDPPARPPRDGGAPAKDAAPDVVVVDAGPPADPCSFDTECTSGDQVCNWKTDTCAAPGPLGAPCKRDLECTEGLCNWKLTECSDPAPAGTPCRRNKECASGVCSSTTSLCK